MSAKTAILANGAPPQSPWALAALHDAERLIACDGAWRTAVELGRTPDAVVGDGDSLRPCDLDELKRLGIPQVCEREQDTNDLCKAFRYALRNGMADDGIVILGATGKREDHAIGNIFHLIDFAEMLGGDGVSIMTDSGVFEPVLPPGRSWGRNDCRAGTAVSVFAPLPGTEMASEGLEWPLDKVAFDALWRATLNRAKCGDFSIRSNRPAIVYRTHHGFVV